MSVSNAICIASAWGKPTQPYVPRHRSWWVPKVTSPSNVSMERLLHMLFRDLASFHHWFFLAVHLFDWFYSSPFYFSWSGNFFFFFWITTQLFPFFFRPCGAHVFSHNKDETKFLKLSVLPLYFATGSFSWTLTYLHFCFHCSYFTTLPISISCLISFIYNMWMQWVYKRISQTSSFLANLSRILKETYFYTRLKHKSAESIKWLTKGDISSYCSMYKRNNFIG